MEDFYVGKKWGVEGFIETFCEVSPPDSREDDPKEFFISQRSNVHALYCRWLWYAQTHVETKKYWPFGLPNSPMALSSAIKARYGLKTERRFTSIKMGERTREQKPRLITEFLGLRIRRTHNPFFGERSVWHPLPWVKEFVPFGNASHDPDHTYAPIAEARRIMKEISQRNRDALKKGVPGYKKTEVEAALKREQDRVFRLISAAVTYFFKYNDRAQVILDEIMQELYPPGYQETLVKNQTAKKDQIDNLVHREPTGKTPKSVINDWITLQEQKRMESDDMPWAEPPTPTRQPSAPSRNPPSLRETGEYDSKGRPLLEAVIPPPTTIDEVLSNPHLRTPQNLQNVIDSDDELV